MKKGRWSNPKVRCPYYKYQATKYQEALQAIFCEGVQPGSSIRLSFSAPECREYMSTYCQNDYRACWICQEHLRAHGEH